MRDYLLNNILPFWMKHSIDEKCGGIITCLDREGKPYGYEKNVWFVGRAMYIFSAVYNTVKKDSEYLRVAERMFDFLPKCANESGRLAFIVNREGKVITRREAYFSETFAAMGCAEYYLATKNPEAREKTELYFDIAYKLYRAELERKADAEAAQPITKALGPSMIMLNVCQVLRKLDHSKYHSIARECAEEILCHLTPYGLLENVGMNNEFIDSPRGREINPGHSLEAGWFLLAEGVYRNDARLQTAAKEIIDISMDLGYRDGGIIAFTDCLGRPSSHHDWDMKIWWPQCEAMIANRLAYAVFGEEKYIRDFESLRQYVFSRYPDPEHGEWYGYLHADGTVANSLKGNISKGPYHLPRMLMLIDRIERGMCL